VAAGDEVEPEIPSARKPDVREQPSVPVAGVLRPVPAEHDGLAVRQPARRGARPRRSADPALGRIDPDQPDPLALPAREEDV